MHVASMGWRIKVLEENLKEKAHLEDLCVDGKEILKKKLLQRNILGSFDSGHGSCRALVNTVLNF